MSVEERPVIFDDQSELPKVFVGGRKSKLALVQTQHVAAMLKKVHPDYSFPVLGLTTLGDQVQSKPLYSFDGKALWTKELETLLLEKVPGFDQQDIIVHSLKDMPTVLPDGCELGAILTREDPRDALVMAAGSPYKTLADLPAGSVVGTSSIRRSAQLKKSYPGLVYESVRGNVGTRLSKLDDPETPYKCLILAAAGLKRLDLGDRITGYLQKPDMLHAVGQGALGLEIRQGDEKTKKILEAIYDKESTLCCLAERAVMRTLEGGCSVPIGVETKYENGKLTLDAIVVSVEGTEFVECTQVRAVEENWEAEQLGKDVAEQLVKDGAKKILDAIHLENIK
ncbi:porphobilinogen deaminase [Yarrowia lipolytica]|jgi:hydroxymethylbilane synthase|uniref:Porphobilinogen deaminase n=2 Tax=Yarrowia lipolytica TaxID=4952 RepID=HEM3_YARLI|nr:YALI0F26609p [Yarrowia lipolytica CLIB122]Q6C097.1 RecName: Full=Porphobilinogen deaminase; Short=PBG; AltName: Full=Hydroxymethylbilane synthase; Short=HMBS; AltName: Full=Pre-uroporphyrinogen synthase [Yarrowia lipolytica CLIB122]AOW07748.1 hypothetical protein YALI1_F34051g [Yarrowia lipolytica]KAB8284549.1 porphobilinogen deaminase [Yarrowia lipolytica]KAE8174410.1 porphobilinogen deaminase [Yarrowia lipolytica]KAJ8055200.1 porphobilinogen deaminase [Yarrowia lipolytica]QNP99659.1 Porp|eukprot:XP_505915.1 YALI0F26609p [Yarrowia lipolytica CLIB122]